MKRILPLALVVLFIVALASCKSHHRCAAYGKVEYKQVDERI